GNAYSLLGSKYHPRLQWSRGVVTAETWQLLADLTMAPSASMEPRCCHRGNATAAGVNGARVCGLQWSRGVVTAETCRMGDCRLVDRGASMEPRCCHRGNVDRSRCPIRRTSTCFNGAAVLSPRKRL